MSRVAKVLYRALLKEIRPDFTNVDFILRNSHVPIQYCKALQAWRSSDIVFTEPSKPMDLFIFTIR